MSVNEIPKEILDKLNKLKNLEEGARSVGSYSEAENAAARFQQLLYKYNLDEEQVRNSHLEEKIRMSNEEIDLSRFYGYRAANWAQDLLSAVAKHSMCIVIITGKWKVHVLGEKQNVNLAIYFSEQLASKIEHAYKFSWTAYKGEEDQKTFRRGFLRGAVMAISMRLRVEEKKATTAPENNGLSLVLANKRQQAMDFLKTEFPNSCSRTKKWNQAGGEDGFGRGKEAGGNMSLNKGLGSVDKKRLT
jgi:hypothetical protein